MIKIEKDIKLGRCKIGRKNKYPFEECKKGEGFFVQIRSASELSGSVNYWNKKLYPRHFKYSTVDENGTRFERDGKKGIMVVRVQ